MHKFTVFHVAQFRNKFLGFEVASPFLMLPLPAWQIKLLLIPRSSDLRETKLRLYRASYIRVDLFYAMSNSTDN